MSRALALLMALGALLLSGCGQIDAIRHDFIAMRYMQEAEAHATGIPRDSARAIEELDRAVELMPDDAELQRRAARLYTVARAWHRAIPLFEAQGELGPQDRLVYAQCLLAAGRTEAGAAICLETIANVMQQREGARTTQPEWALLLNDAGYILADADSNVDRAWEAISIAVEAMPLQAAFIDSLGWAAYRRGDLSDAAFYLERGRRHSAYDDPEMLYHLGVVYGRLGRFGDATKALEKAHELAPDWEEIEKELRRIGRIFPRPALATDPDESGAA